MSAETIFERYASRVLFLVCDESADKSLLVSGVLVSPDGEVQRRFRIDADYAKECEGYFGKGESAFLGNREVIIKVDD